MSDAVARAISSVSTLGAARRAVRRGWAGSGNVEQLFDESFDQLIDLVADDPNSSDRLAGGVVELPVEVALAGEVGAGVAAAHRDDDVGGGDGVVGELSSGWRRSR